MQSPLAELVAWIALPALVLITSCGVGLLVEHVLRIRLPGVLVAPLGACTAIVLLMPGYTIGAGAWLGVVVLLAATAAGVWPVRGDLREQAARLMPRWAGVAALAVFALYMAPVVFSGGWTWTGYNFVNDTAFQFVLTDWVGRHGIPYDEQLRSTTSETVRVYLLTPLSAGRTCGYGNPRRDSPGAGSRHLPAVHSEPRRAIRARARGPRGPGRPGRALGGGGGVRCS